MVMSLTKNIATINHIGKKNEQTILMRIFFPSIFPQLSDSNDGYTPLQRPNTSTTTRETASSLPSSLGASGITKMEDASELDESLPESDTDSNSDCEFSTVRNRPNKKKVLK